MGFEENEKHETYYQLVQRSPGLHHHTPRYNFWQYGPPFRTMRPSQPSGIHQRSMAHFVAFLSPLSAIVVIVAPYTAGLAIGIEGLLAVSRQVAFRIAPVAILSLRGSITFAAQLCVD